MSCVVANSGATINILFNVSSYDAGMVSVTCSVAYMDRDVLLQKEMIIYVFFG
jgi:hypothetical protein